MDGAEGGAGRQEAPAKPACGDRLKVSKELYDEVQREFRFHDDANASLDKKAQNLMIATALVAALFVALISDGTAGWQNLTPIWLGMAIVLAAGVALTVALCIRVNLPSPQPVPIAGGGLLRRDRLDDKAYEELLAGGEEDYYASRIEEYALALARQEAINKKKSGWLIWAYVAFAVFPVGAVLITSVLSWTSLF